jgi:hypothetical protein
MANIRNRFAHRLSTVDFRDKEVVKSMEALQMIDKKVGDISSEELKTLIEAHQREPEKFLDEVKEELGRFWAGLPPAERTLYRFTGATEALKVPRTRFIITAQLMSYSIGSFDSPNARYPLI